MKQIYLSNIVKEALALSGDPFAIWLLQWNEGDEFIYAVALILYFDESYQILYTYVKSCVLPLKLMAVKLSGRV